MVPTFYSMAKIKGVMDAITQVEKKITEEVKKGSGRDKKVIRKLQEEHAALTASLSRLLKADRVTPKDGKDTSREEHKKEAAKKQAEKQKAFEIKHAEKLTQQAIIQTN